MKKRWLTICLILGAVVMFLGCHGGGGMGSEVGEDSTPEGYTSVRINGSGSSGSAAMDEFGEFLAISSPFKDAGAGTDGTGSGGPESIADTAASTCIFDGPAGDVSEDGYIEVYTSSVASATDCTDESNCIYCVVNTAAQANCTISCDGLVASNSLSAADTILFTLTTYHAFTTEMPAANGMIRIDGDATSLDSESLLSASVDDEGTNARVYVGCENGVTDSGSDLVTSSGTAGSGMALNTHASGVWAVGYDITALDATVGEGTAGGCHISDKLTIVAAFTGADTPDASLDLAFTAISMDATICDTEDVCAAF